LQDAYHDKGARTVDFPVIVRAESPDRFTAEPLGLPELKAAAKTEAEAIERATLAIGQWLATAKVIQVSVPVPEAGNPWLDGFGRSANDPDFGDYLEELNRSRAAELPG
jgi:hypothetical protein